MTQRACWIVVLGATALAAGLLLRQEPTAFAGLSLLLWVAVEWFNLSRRLLALGDKVAQAQRTFDADHRREVTVTVDHDVKVIVEVRMSPRLIGYRCRIEELVPAGCTAQGLTVLQVDGPFGGPLRLEYLLRSAVVRRLSFPGLRIVISDACGLFYQRRLLRVPQQLIVLPFLIRPQATVSTLKSHNIQVLAGTHRYRSEGTSTELHGIRDYRTGDPPRSIAWKVTARVGRLMTCEYESEVPARATIFADLSPNQFRGRPGPAAVDRVISTTASVARLLLSDRDPVACSIHAGSKREWIPHGLGERHLARLIWQLLAREPQCDMQLNLETLSQLAWVCGRQMYPELFEPGLNRTRSLWPAWQRRQSQLARQREELSVALAAIHHGDAGLVIQLQTDDELYRQYCDRLLAVHGGVIDLPPSVATESLAAERETVEAIGRGIMTAVTRARDNELYVLVGSIPRERSARDKLLEAIRVARSRLHRVMLIDVSSPASVAGIIDPMARKVVRSEFDATQRDQHDEFSRSLASCGAKVARLDNPRLLHLIAAEIELIKSGRARTREHHR